MNDGTDMIAARLRKHTVEIERIQEAHRQELEQLRKQADSNAERWRMMYENKATEVDILDKHVFAAISESKRWRFRCFVFAFASVALSGILCVAIRMNASFSDGDAPKLQRLTVVTEGYVDKKGTWRSFDTGEPITVKQWRQ